ncbi:MAG: formate dehydrogenase accessory sulfurtransferase FdhD [Candidatus Dormibacteria bacterium]
MALRTDDLATEEPMETRLLLDGQPRSVAVTMRTPGADFELAVGFLYGEWIISRENQVGRVSYCVDPAVDAEQRYNIVNVEIRGQVTADLRGLDRHFYTSSACGVCGKASIDSLKTWTVGGIDREAPLVRAAVIRELPGKLRQGQGLFERTGGLHAAALFDRDGEVRVLREDVGRHNAVDKVVGWGLLGGQLPFSNAILMVSGRTSYEIIQKAVAAGIPVVCAISAPSSLAVDVAREFGVTLVGFLREGRFNVYSGEQRISPG